MVQMNNLCILLAVSFCIRTSLICRANMILLILAEIESKTKRYVR